MLTSSVAAMQQQLQVMNNLMTGNTSRTNTTVANNAFNNMQHTRSS